MNSLLLLARNTKSFAVLQSAFQFPFIFSGFTLTPKAIVCRTKALAKKAINNRPDWHHWKVIRKKANILLCFYSTSKQIVVYCGYARRCKQYGLPCFSANVVNSRVNCWQGEISGGFDYISRIVIPVTVWPFSIIERCSML